MDSFVNCTLRGAWPELGEAVNLAEGVTVRVAALLALRPLVSVTVRLVEKTPSRLKV